MALGERLNWVEVGITENGCHGHRHVRERAFGPAAPGLRKMSKELARFFFRKCSRVATDFPPYGRLRSGIHRPLARTRGAPEMMTDFDSAACAAVQITRAAPLFDQLVDVLLSHAALAGYSSNTADGAARQARLRATRERLDAYYSDFQTLYFDLLSKHLGEQLPAVLDALSNDLVQAYLKAQKSMEHELIGDLQRLAEKMAAVVPLDDEGADAAPPDQRSELAARATKFEERPGAGRAASMPNNRTLV
jgi:hypothetical protein